MRVVSQNGWPVLNADATTLITAAGRSWRLARGQVANVFADFITRYDRDVEPINPGQLDDWAWAVRTVRGSATVISNHASGTAIDINALAHPRSAHDTFTRAQLIRLHQLLDDYPVIRWGGTFGTTVDEMHFEINCTPAALDTWLRTGSRPAPTTGSLTRPVTPTTDPEDDVVTPADIDAIAEAVWAKSLKSRGSDPRGDWNARDRLTSLDYTLQAIVLPALDHLPVTTADEVWERSTVAVRHPRTDAEQTIAMGTALGRAASVIWDGKQAGVLTKPTYLPVAAATEHITADAGPEASTTAALADIGQQLSSIHSALQELLDAALNPVPSAVTGSTSALTPSQMAAQTHARVLQVVGLVSGVRGALDVLAVAAAKGNLPSAEALQDAVNNAMRAALPQVQA